MMETVIFGQFNEPLCDKNDQTKPFRNKNSQNNLEKKKPKPFRKKNSQNHLKKTAKAI